MKRLAKFIVLVAVAGVSVWLANERLEDLLAQCQLKSLEKTLAGEMGPERARSIMARVASHLELIRAGEPARAKGIMRFHTLNAMIALALYRALADQGVEGDLVEEAARLLWMSGMSDLSRSLGKALERSRDPFELFEKGVRFANKVIFPAPYWEKRDVEMEEGIGFDFSRCFYYDFLERKGAPELTWAFCEMDTKMDEQFPSQVELVRSGTLSKGGDVCDFRYYHR